MRRNFHEYHDMKIVGRIPARPAGGNPDSGANRDKHPMLLAKGKILFRVLLKGKRHLQKWSNR